MVSYYMKVTLSIYTGSIICKDYNDALAYYIYTGSIICKDYNDVLAYHGQENR